MRHVFLPYNIFDADSITGKGKSDGSQKTDNSSPRIPSRSGIESPCVRPHATLSNHIMMRPVKEEQNGARSSIDSNEEIVLRKDNCMKVHHTGVASDNNPIMNEPFPNRESIADSEKRQKVSIISVLEKCDNKDSQNILLNNNP